VRQQHLELGDCRPTVTAGWKVCTMCGVVKPLSSYYTNVLYRDNRRSCCKRCHVLLNKLGQSEYRPRLIQRFHDEQNGLCPVCNLPLDLDDRLVLDHPHSEEAMHDVHTLAASMTGLLHLTCNVGLGMLNDDPAVLRRAARYIEQTRRYGQQTLDLTPIP
jgi:hypothetical protein